MIATLLAISSTMLGAMLLAFSISGVFQTVFLRGYSGKSPLATALFICQ
jgi:hypothetical protein